MRRKSNLDMELPWQIDAFLLGGALAISAVIVGIGVMLFNTVFKAFFESLSASLGSVVSTQIPSVSLIFPLIFAFFLAVALHFYFTFRRSILRRLKAF